MNKLLLPLSIFAILFTVACGGEKEKKDEKTEDSNAKEAKTEETKVEDSDEMVAPPDSAAMMQAWMAYMTPGEMHSMFAKFDGTWDEEISMWMAPDAPATTSKSVAVNKMVMGGRYQESTHSGSFDGMPFEGKSTLAYDNATKEFISTWIDNMGTGIMVLKGTWDESTKSINFSGPSIDPMTGKTMNVREVFTIIDDKTQKMEMYSDQYGKEFKTMEIIFKKRK